MGRSVSGAHQAYIGEVIYSKGYISYKVLKIIEGGGCIGDTLFARGYNYQKGDTVVVVIPEHISGAWYTTFPITSLEEVKYLLNGSENFRDEKGRKTYDYQDLTGPYQAKMCLMGYSYQAVEAAQEYFGSNYVENQYDLFSMADSLISRIVEGKQLVDSEWQLNNVLETIFAMDANEPEIYLADLATSLRKLKFRKKLKLTKGGINDWDYLMKAIIGSINHNQKYYKRFMSIMCINPDDLPDQLLSALAYGEMHTIGDLKKIEAVFENRADILANGILKSSQRHGRWWAKDAGIAHAKYGLTYAQNPWLKKELRKQIERLDGLFARK